MPLRANGVKVSTAGRGLRRASSAARPGRPAEAARRQLRIEPARRGDLRRPAAHDAPTGVVESTCFRQVEFAGVLRGTDHETEARKLVDFLISARFQNELPLNLFVYPARTDTTLPAEFTKFAVVAAKPFTIAPADIAANRQQWQDEWTTIVLR